MLAAVGRAAILRDGQKLRSIPSDRGSLGRRMRSPSSNRASATQASSKRGNVERVIEAQWKRVKNNENVSKDLDENHGVQLQQRSHRNVDILRGLAIDFMPTSWSHEL